MAADHPSATKTIWLEYHLSDLPILDVRSPAEFASGHFPGSYNLPLLNNEERHEVGIVYKASGQQAAIQRGLKLVGPRFADITEEAMRLCGDKKTLIYCWRGGLRSQIMSWLLRLSGIHVTKVDHGYKSWRHLVLQQFDFPWDLVLVSGMTGSGKTGLLLELMKENKNVIDLEGLANHKGSAFGGLGQLPQPTQEHFENLLGLALLRSDARSPLIMEDESRFIGRLRIPDSIFTKMQQAPLVEVDRDLSWRVNKILGEYAVFNLDALIDATEQLRKRMGGEQVSAAIAALKAGDKASWVKQLLMYYDRTYQHSRLKSKREVLFTIRSEEDFLASIAKNIWKQSLPE